MTEFAVDDIILRNDNGFIGLTRVFKGNLIDSEFATKNN